MKKQIVLVVILSIVLVLCLAAAFALNTGLFTDLVPTQTEPTAYTVSFQVQDALIAQQTVVENTTPQVLTETVPGVHITGWTDAQGQPVDPFAVPVTADICYQAVFYPELSRHVPFLFVDSDGLLLPEEPLTWEDLSRAVHALASEEAVPYLPAVSGESTPIPRADLTACLNQLFDGEAVAAAFGGTQVPTRSVFAAGMCTLLERGGDELLAFDENTLPPADITFDRQDAAALLEACTAHTVEDTGITWDQVALPTDYEPGFVNTDGQLYYVQEDHYLLRDGYVGTLYFDAGGRYTCGDAQLDATVVSVLGDLIAQNPGADRFTLLRAVYDYCHQTYTYRRTYDHPEYGSTGWEIQRAKDMFETGKGNCYSFAAIFWALSRALGYETRAVSGKVLADEQPHSWCFIELDGEDYIFDPQWQNNYTERGIFEHDMFQIPRDRFSYWLYQWE